MAYIGFPLDTAYAIASLMTGGTLTRHPRLRLAFSHGGGAFASILPRLTHGWKSRPAVAECIGVSPYEHARRLFYDTLVYDGPTLRHLIDTFGVRQLCLGTDFPFDIYERHPVEAVAALALSDGDVQLLHHDNAARFTTSSPSAAHRGRPCSAWCSMPPTSRPSMACMPKSWRTASRPLIRPPDCASRTATTVSASRTRKAATSPSSAGSRIMPTRPTSVTGRANSATSTSMPATARPLSRAIVMSWACLLYTSPSPRD